MDGVALASVIGSASLGALGLGLSFIAIRQTARLAREGRHQARLERASLEVLQYAELEGQWVHATYSNLELTTWDEYHSMRRHTAERPPRTQLATAAALMSAFGSEGGRAAFDAWSTSVKAVDTEEQRLAWNWENEGDRDYRFTKEDIAQLKELVNEEAQYRQVLGNALAAELRTEPA